MAARSIPISPPDGDFTYRALVERVVAGDEAAWQDFVERFSNLIFSLVWRYANSDQDLCSDLYLAVIEGLHATNDRGETFYRLRRYLASVDQYDGKGRLTTWLGRVTQNLVSDHFRTQEGRKTIPRAIGRLDNTSQQIFKLLYWDNLTEREAFGVIDGQAGGFEREEFDRIIDGINRELKTCNRWSIYSEVIRRTPALPLHPVDHGGEDIPQVQVADTDPRSRPHQSAVEKMELARAEEMGKQLIRLIGELPEESRTLLVCRFRHGMTAGQIARVLGREDTKRIYGEIDRIKDQLKDGLRKAGFDWEQVASGLWAMEGLLDGLDAGLKNSSSP